VDKKKDGEALQELTLVLTKEEIAKMVSDVAEKISIDYEGGEIFLIGALKGSFIFMADLARAISIPVYIDFIGATSYGSETTSSGTIEITKDIALDLKNKDVIIVEDIVDSGLTMKHLINRTQSLMPTSIKTCTLIDKYERRECEINVDYACHTTNTGFLVGYGLDYNEKYRELPAIYNLKL